MPSSKATILVIEDEPDFRRLLEDILGENGYRVVSAGNGEDGLKLFTLESPDLVILDGQLPDMDGFEVLERIRSQGPRPQTPVFLCTVRSAVSPVAQGLAAGATDYVVKPFSAEDLLARIESALGSGSR